MRELRKYIANVQAGREQGVGARVLVALLLPASLIYGLILFLRELGFRSGLLPQLRLPGKVISIGNLTTGGTGKTSLTLQLAQTLGDWGCAPAVLTRGYGAAYSHSDLILQAGHVDYGAMDWLADEVILLATRLDDCWIGIGKDRFANGRKLHEQHGAKLFILDDGLSHRKIVHDLEIVLIDAANPFGNGQLLPAGSLREGRGALRRSDLVLLTHCEAVTDAALDSLEHELSEYCGADTILWLRTELTGLRDLSTGTAIARNSLLDKTFIAFSGLGNPTSFAALLRDSGLQLESELDYGDHYRYTETDVNHLLKLIADRESVHLVTTAKDAVKLPRERFQPNACLIAEIQLVFDSGAAIFESKIREVAAC
ncbi:MAG: tetraacyldisaccharide 4'-kinase [bacterium]